MQEMCSIRSTCILGKLKNQIKIVYKEHLTIPKFRSFSKSYAALYSLEKNYKVDNVKLIYGVKYYLQLNYYKGI